MEYHYNAHFPSLVFTIIKYLCNVNIGKYCEVEQAPCASHPCEKGGVCIPSADYTSYTCRCPAGWQGMCVLFLKYCF